MNTVKSEILKLTLTLFWWISSIQIFAQDYGKYRGYNDDFGGTDKGGAWYTDFVLFLTKIGVIVMVFIIVLYGISKLIEKFKK